MRSLARARSSSRRAPPNAASKPCSAIASSSVTVCSRLRDARGAGLLDRAAGVDRLLHGGDDQLARRAPPRARSRNSMTSGKLCPVSTCMTGNGSGAGRNAFSASRSSTIESLPPREQQHGLLELGRDLAHDVDRLGLERLEVGQRARDERHAQTAHSPSPRTTWNGTLRFQSMKWFIVSRPNSTGMREVARPASSKRLRADARRRRR